MIITGLLSVVTTVLSFIFGLLPIPDMPESLVAAMDSFFELLRSGLGLFDFFLGPVAKLLIVYVLAIETVRHIWDLIWFIIRKIPILNIKE